MIIDHCGIVFKHNLSTQVYYLLRGIGRISFPIFCFLLVEGFFHTGNRNRYLSRLLLFSILSEIPYDLALKHSDASSLFTIMDWTSQNVFFTLVLGMAAMMVIEYYQYNNLSWICSAILFSSIADFCHTDYGSLGIITILFFYLHKKRKSFPLWLCMIPLLTSAINTPIQGTCILSLFFLAGYNGQKGRGPKYLFYTAYPAHLLLLYLISNRIL